MSPPAQRNAAPAPGGTAPPAREASAFSEINRLHAEARQLARESRRSLDAALSAAWRAGQLLIEEKARIRRRAGQGAYPTPCQGR